jgi:hypothetical protein
MTEERSCQNCKGEFVIEDDDFSFYEKMSVPPPTLCPQCRAVRRFIFWDERNLFRKKDARTGKEIFSTFSEQSPVTIYEHDYWWSDAWDPTAYGREYDFSRPFFVQLSELIRAVPWPSRSIKNLVNSDYCNNSSDLKNCYLCFNGGAHGDKSEDCMYGVSFLKMRNSIDFYYTSNCELCYEIFSCGDCYQAFFTLESNNCRNVSFCMNCDDCSDCFGCVNLRHKQYHIFNKPYSKEEYQRKLAELNLGSYAALTPIKQRVYGFWKQFPMKYLHGMHNTNGVGEYLYHSKNIHLCYQVFEAENARYSQNLVRCKDVGDYTSWGNNSELIYESVVCGEDCRNLKFCVDCWPACRDLEYSLNCHAASSSFGCVGLKKGQYCILNKHYTKEEYESLVPKVREHIDAMPYADARGRKYGYGEFLPPELSPLSYNESAAEDYFPLGKEKAVAAGFIWRDPAMREFKKTLHAKELPDAIGDAPESITKEVIECLGCSRAYRILAAELEFYKRFSLPLPRLCPNCRYDERRKFRNQMRWYRRGCMCGGQTSDSGSQISGIRYRNSAQHLHGSEKCPNEFETSYAPERPEIIYCESCYNAEVA